MRFKNSVMRSVKADLAKGEITITFAVSIDIDNLEEAQDLANQYIAKDAASVDVLITPKQRTLFDNVEFTRMSAQTAVNSLVETMRPDLEDKIPEPEKAEPESYLMEPIDSNLDKNTGEPLTLANRVFNFDQELSERQVSDDAIGDPTAEELDKWDSDMNGPEPELEPVYSEIEEDIPF